MPQKNLPEQGNINSTVIIVLACWAKNMLIAAYHTAKRGFVFVDIILIRVVHIYIVYACVCMVECILIVT